MSRLQREADVIPTPVLAGVHRTVTSTSETYTTIKHEYVSSIDSAHTSRTSVSSKQESIKAAYVPRKATPELSQMESGKQPGSPDFTCTAIVYDSSNLLGLAVKKDVHVKPPGKRELLIRVFAASINPVDYKLNTVAVVGLFQDGKIVGHDFCGEVVQIGYKVQNFKVGDHVYGFAHGSLSQYCLAEESKVAIKPAKVLSSPSSPALHVLIPPRICLARRLTSRAPPPFPLSP
jgi:hypothetical protein